jgi:hypothetical protein
MGYTHYFPGLRATGLRSGHRRRRKIIDASPVTICGPKGQGLPILNEADGIRLNGFEAAGEAYETFHLRGTKNPAYPDMWTFCKTEEKPYDVVVTAILIAAAVRSLDPSRRPSEERWALGQLGRRRGAVREGGAPADRGREDRPGARRRSHAPHAGKP